LIARYPALGAGFIAGDACAASDGGAGYRQAALRRFEHDALGLSVRTKELQARSEIRHGTSHAHMCAIAFTDHVREALIRASGDSHAFAGLIAGYRNRAAHERARHDQTTRSACGAHLRGSCAF
jgi:hypothetical protein